MKTYISATLIFLAGIATGWWLAHHDQHSTAPLATQRMPIATGDMPAAASGPLLGVEIVDARGNLLERGNGVLLAPRMQVLLPLSALYDAAAARIYGSNASLGQVIGINTPDNLALLSGGPAGGNALHTTDGTSLYLGLELQALFGDDSVDGWIDTAARQSDNGATVFGFHAQNAHAAGFAPLIDTATGKLAGILTGRMLNDTLLEAIDADALQHMTTPAGDGRPLTVGQFAGEFFRNTVEGRLLAVQRAATQQNWQAVLQQGRPLLADVADSRRIDALLANAWLALAHDALQRGATDEALRLLREAVQTLPAQLQLRHALASACMTARQPLAALQALTDSVDAAIAGDDTWQLIERVVRDALPGNLLSNDEKQQLLESAMRYQPGAAWLHAELGDQYYARGRYADALNEFNYASQLDASYYATLAERMRDARGRRQLPDRIIVPLQAEAGSYHVDTLINGRSRRLLLDTGASFTVLSRALADELGIATEGARQVKLSTANGIVDAPLVRIDSIELNGARINGIEAVVLDNLQGSGLLGLNFLNHFNIDIDQAQGRMTLARRGS